MLGLKDTAKKRYTNLGDAQAEFCKKCGKCEKLCPQSIKIREDLQRVVQDIIIYKIKVKIKSYLFLLICGIIEYLKK